MTLSIILIDHNHQYNNFTQSAHNPTLKTFASLRRLPALACRGCPLGYCVFAVKSLHQANYVLIYNKSR